MDRMFTKSVSVLFAVALVATACNGSADNTTTSAPNIPTTASTSTLTSTVIETTTTTVLPPVEPADIVFIGGDVVTVDASYGTVEALAVSGSTIAAVGSSTDIERYIGPNTEIIDLDGRMLGPGFVDPHTHILTDAAPFEEGQQMALEAGITSLADGSAEPDMPEQFIERAASGELRVRTGLYLTITDPCGEHYGDWYQAYEPGQLDDRLRILGVKIFADGGVCGLVASSEPWAVGVPVGKPYHTDEQMRSWIQDAQDRGMQVIIHAQGDLAITQALDAYESVLKGAPNVLRHRIDHNVFVTPEIAPRYGEIGIVPAVFGGSSACTKGLEWEPIFINYGNRPNAIGLANPGIIVAWHGDDPWVLPIGAVPDLFSLVARTRVGDDGEICEAPDWMKAGGVPIDEALRMMTINAAYAIHAEDDVGSLTPGKLADLVVLSDNVLEIPTRDLLDVEVLATIIGGTTEYCAPGHQDLCPGIEPPDVDVTASASRPGHGPELAFDGVTLGESFWSSGADAPGWIQQTFPEPVTVSEIRFIVYQTPPSDSVHKVEVLVNDAWSVVTTFTGYTEIGDVLVWHPDVPLEGVKAFRITTLESASWPEWYDIEVDTVE